MGNILSALWNEGEDEFEGLTEDEAKQAHQEIKKEYSHPAWSSIVACQSSLKWNNLARKSVKRRTQVIKEEDSEQLIDDDDDNEEEKEENDENQSAKSTDMAINKEGDIDDEKDGEEVVDGDNEVGEKASAPDEDMDTMVEINGAIINKRLLQRVIQKWESLDSEGGVSVEEEDNVCNTLEELREESGEALAEQVSDI